jgi:hypothetical protein
MRQLHIAFAPTKENALIENEMETARSGGCAGLDEHRTFFEVFP